MARTDTASQQALDEATNEEAAARADVAEIGENVRAGQPVLAVSASGKQWLSFNVREDYLRDLAVGAVVRVTRSGSHEPMPAVVTELRPLGSFATWQAERAIGDHDRNTLRYAWIRRTMRADWKQA